MPEDGSLDTSGVAASSAAVMPDRRRAHGCPGATTTVSASEPACRAASPGDRSGPSTNPISAAPTSTAAATSAELPAVSATVVIWRRPRSAVSQPGSRYSATVMEATTRSTASPRSRSEVMPASSAAAASTAACAQPATSSPCGVSREPCGDRSISVTPSRRSSRRIRVLAAGWEIPCACAAMPTLPSRATDSSRSNGIRSATRSGRVITSCYGFIPG